MKHYYVLPDYRILTTDDKVPDELIRGGGSDDGDLIDSFKKGEVRRELEPAYHCEGYEGQLEGESDLEFYRRDPIAFTFESGIATFRYLSVGKILEADEQYIIAQSKIIIPSWEARS
jgi:hypothetical protein